MINVTYTWLPPRDVLDKYIDQIYDQHIVTNNGPLIKEFEQKLMDSLAVPHLSVVSSGHTANMIALKALGIQGKILTTPFSFVSTLQCILWQGSEPVFADISAQTFGIDPDEIERVLSKQKDISAILATHLFGNTCDVESIKDIADYYKIPVIYDGAHSFGVKYKGQSIFQYGDVSTISFQAYKPLHMAEGGAVITSNLEIAERIKNVRYFGINVKEQIVDYGLNGKTSELHAALGLCSLDIQETSCAHRKQLAEVYYKELESLPISWMIPTAGSDSNHSYFPIVLRTEEEAVSLQNALLNQGVQTKRYFFPSLNTLSSIITPTVMPRSEYLSKRILCLPIHIGLQEEEVRYIISAIKNYFN